MMNKLEIQSLSKFYKNKKALNDFTCEINGGEIVGLIGVNGAGKTTLLNSISGVIVPTSGEMFFNNTKMKLNSQLRSDFGISINPGFYDYMNTYNNLQLIQYLNSKKKNTQLEIKDILDLVGLYGVEKEKVKSFSFGMKQRLGFGQAILNAEKFMILDEPFVGLDVNGRNIVKKYIKKLVYEKNIGVLFSDHNLDEVKDLCNRIIVIKEGKKIYDGDLITQDKILVKVEDSEKLLEYQDIGIEILEKNCLSLSSLNLDKNLRLIMNLTTITNIYKAENPLEAMLKGEVDVNI